MVHETDPAEAAPRAAGPRPVLVVGGGNFGTAIADIVAARGPEVRLWLRDAELAETLRVARENTRYLPGHRLHDRITPSTDLAAAVRDVEFALVCVPSASFEEVAQALGRSIEPGTPVVSATKGIHALATPRPDGRGFRLMSEVLEAACPDSPVGVLSGPNLAEEIAVGDFTGTVIASEDASLRERVQARIHSRSFRVYSNPDRFGVELAGALKNVYAIAAGMAAGLNAGQNTQAMLITRGLGEMSRFAARLGADPLTFLGLAGVGDLLVTCTSPLSRNHQLGLAVGRGATLEEASASLGRLAEGVNTIEVVRAEARRLGLDLPIVQGLHEILFEGQPLAEVLIRLMLSEQRDDVEFVAGARA